MSRSSLWVLDKEYNGSIIADFSNSWSLSPIAADILFEKYLPEEVNGPYGKQTYMGLSSFNDELPMRLNQKKMNRVF